MSREVKVHTSRDFTGGKHKFNLDPVDHYLGPLCSNHILGFNVGHFAALDHLAKPRIDKLGGTDLEVFTIHIITSLLLSLSRPALFFQNPFGEPFRGHDLVAATSVSAIMFLKPPK